MTTFRKTMAWGPCKKCGGSEFWLNYVCVQCQRDRDKLKNIESYQNFGVSLTTLRKRGSYRANVSHLLSVAKRRHRSDPSFIAVTHEYLVRVYEVQQGLCALSGVMMTWGSGQLENSTMTLDRIDPALGYIEGNVQFLCHLVNSSKRSMTNAQYIEFCRNIYERARIKDVPGHD